MSELALDLQQSIDDLSAAIDRKNELCEQQQQRIGILEAALRKAARGLEEYLGPPYASTYLAEIHAALKGRTI